MPRWPRSTDGISNTGQAGNAMPDDDPEDEPTEICPGAGDSRDPAYDPSHAWEAVGEFDGDTILRCRRCRQTKLE